MSPPYGVQAYSGLNTGGASRDTSKMSMKPLGARSKRADVGGTLLKNTGGVADALVTVYAEPALVPASPWLDGQPPSEPDVSLRADRRELRIEPTGEPARWFVIRKLQSGKWETLIHRADGKKVIRVSFAAAVDKVVVTAINRVGNESKAVEVAK